MSGHQMSYKFYIAIIIKGSQEFFSPLWLGLSLRKKIAWFFCLSDSSDSSFSLGQDQKYSGVKNF